MQSPAHVAHSDPHTCLFPHQRVFILHTGCPGQYQVGSSLTDTVPASPRSAGVADVAATVSSTTDAPINLHHRSNTRSFPFMPTSAAHAHPRRALPRWLALETPRLPAQVFEHLHSLDFTYHVGRQTGGLARAIDRGTRGINFILSSMIFNVVPTALEVLLVAGILAYKCGPPLAALALATLAAYTWFTFTMTAWRTQFRVRMNKMDAKASTRAVDALLNYETVWNLSPPLSSPPDSPPLGF